MQHSITSERAVDGVLSLVQPRAPQSVSERLERNGDGNLNADQNCPGTEHLVVLRSTCHRCMHYADVGNAIRDEKVGQVSIDGEEFVFAGSVDG